MKHLCTRLLLHGLAIGLATILTGQTLPTPTATTVTAVPATGALRSPANFWTANAAAISASVSDAVGLIPFEEPGTASGSTVSGDEFLLWSPILDAPLDEGFAGWVTASTFRERLGVDSEGIAGLLTDGGIFIGGLRMEEPPLSGPGAPNQFAVFFGEDEFFTWQTPSGARAQLELTSAATGDASGLTTGTVANARLDADLAALANNSTSGLLVRTGAGTAAARTLAATAPLAVTNADGVAGNPSLTITNATESAVGVVELATSAEAITGTDTTRPPHAAAARAALSAYVDPIALTRPAGDYGYNDGATSGRGIIYSNASRQNIAGVPLFQLAFIIPVSSSAWGAEALVWSSLPSATLNTANALRIYTDTANGLRIRQTGAGGNNDRRDITWNAFRSAYAGRSVRGLITFTQGTTKPIVQIEGVDVSASFTDDNAGTPPQWLDPAMAVAFQQSGLNWFRADHPYVVPILGQMSAGEATTWFTTGRLPFWVHLGGSAAFPNTVFATGLGGTMDSLTGTSASGFTAQETTGGTGYVFTRLDGGLNAGNVVRLLFDATLTSGAVPRVGLGNLGVYSDPDILISAGANVITLTPTRFFNGAIFTTIGDTSYAISNLRVQVNGAITLPGYQGIATARDLSNLGGTQPNQGIMVGVRPVLTAPSPPNIAIFPLSSTGAFLTLGSANPLAFNPQEITRARVVVDTAGADLTFRRNSSSTNDIVTALTDIPSASVTTVLTLIAAQTRLAPGETVWAALSAGTGFLIIETAPTL